jgi:hypothetical protein
MFKPETPHPTPEKKSIVDDMEKMIELAKKLEDVYSHRPDPAHFVGAMANSPKHSGDYTKEKISADIKYVEETRNKIDESNADSGRELLDRKEEGFQLSEMLQTIIIDRINNGWIPDMKGIMTSDFDDIAVGIDSAMKYKKDKYFGTSLDMTITSKEEVAENKIQKNWDRFIKKGAIPTLKYFEDPENPAVKGRRSMPKFIIGGSKKDLEELAEAYLTNNLDSIADHPLKYAVVAQIDEQLQKDLVYYEDNTNDPKLSFANEQYKHFAEVFEDIKKSINFSERMKDLELYEYLKSNTVYQASRNYQPKTETPTSRSQAS